MDKLLKENIIYIVLVFAVIIGGIYLVFTSASSIFGNISDYNAKKEDLVKKQQTLDELKRKKELKKSEKIKKAESGKIIYEVPEQQFSSEASFGIMFDNVLANMTNSGLRIRKIEYNYSPQNDPILITNIRGYNACELSFQVVGTYTQLQTFLKNIAKENYLTSVTEIYMEPWEKDRTILITSFKIRLYTKSI